jgi:nicotinate-nucleotide pyrophosphorylase (carboxylating)
MNWSTQTHALIEAALTEDLGDVGDVTAAVLAQPDMQVRGSVSVRSAGVVCGLALAPLICAAFARRFGGALQFVAAGEISDGSAVAAGARIGELLGPYARVLALERTFLNFLQRLGGVATLTRRYVEAARRGSPGVQVLDTRKTIPGWRELDKYAVRCGGGVNHRSGLYDAVLIKDNHLAGIPLAQLAGRLAAMVRQVRQSVPGRPAPGFVEVEVASLEQFRAIRGVPGVDIIMLDNFEPDAMRTAVAERDAAGLRGRVALEASGGITLDTIAAVAATGVERISVGAITHSAAALDIALDL